MTAIQTQAIFSNEGHVKKFPTRVLFRSTPYLIQGFAPLSEKCAERPEPGAHTRAGYEKYHSSVYSHFSHSSESSRDRCITSRIRVQAKQFAGQAMRLGAFLVGRD